MTNLANPLDRTEEHVDKARRCLRETGTLDYTGDLAVGWKITHTDGTTGRGAIDRPTYFWGLVGPDEPARLHVTDNWDDTNGGSCPSRPGDGLCVATHIRHVTSGGVKLASCIGHVLVYPADLARSDEIEKHRAPWLVQVESFDPLHLIRSGLLPDLAGANLAGVNLAGVNLAGANLAGAYLAGAYLVSAYLVGVNLADAYLAGAYLVGADLAGADLARANLADANLARAVANGFTVWPDGFDPAATGVTVR